MPTLAEIRQQYPQYNDLNDQALSDALYKKFYSDIPREQFDLKVKGEPKSGVTIVPKGGQPREATPQEAQPYIRANVLPAALNQNTGQVEPAIPGFLKEASSAATLPGDVYTGKVDVNSPEAGRRAATFSLLATPAARAPTVTAEAVAPTTEGLKTLAQEAYKTAHESGVTVKPDSFGKMALGALLGAKRAGLDRTLHPKATAALGRIAEAADKKQPLSFQDLDTLRQVVKDAAGSNDAGERRIAHILVDRIDEYMNGLTTKDLAEGKNPAEAVAAIRQARGLWSRMRKSETLDDAVDRAKNAVGANYTAAGFQTALRQQLRSIASNKARMRVFTPEEQSAIKRVVRGAPLENLLRIVGKFAPQGNLATVLSAGAGYGVGGPVGAVALPAAGMLAKSAATNLGQRSFNTLSEMVRRGY